MHNINTDNYCNICQNKIIKISRTNKINGSTNFSWESDSTFKLSKLENAECFLGLCIRCFQTTIYPKFNTNLLYKAEGAETRRFFFEKYYPDKKYSQVRKLNDVKNIYEKMFNEFNRFKNSIDFIALKTLTDNSNDFTILDYGGSDGYIAKIFSLTIQAVSKQKVEIKIYDPSATHLKADQILSDSDFKKNQHKFNLVILSHIIEHTHKPNEILSHAKKFLKPNGVIFCEIPDERQNLIKAFILKKFGLNYHVTHHSKLSLLKLLSNANLKNINTKYINSHSYRGKKMRIILGVGQNNENIINKKSNVFLLVNEIFSFFFMIPIIIFNKIFKTN